MGRTIKLIRLAKSANALFEGGVRSYKP